MRKIIKVLLSVTVVCLIVSCTSLRSDPDSEFRSSETPAGIEDEAAIGVIPASDESYGTAAALDSAEQESLDSDGPEVYPPLNDEMLIKTMQEQLPWNMIQVFDAGKPLAIVHDLDKNGYEDVLVLVVQGDAETDATVDNLSKSARLFESEKEYFSYFLLIFYQNNGEIILRYTVPVSRQLVFNEMTTYEVKSGSDFPYSLLFSFRTRSGIEKELVILSGYGITNFTLRENLSEFTLVDDIDDDGFTDIILHEQGFEEGTGFETFLTWYKWNSREYTEYKNTNIVRNLRNFFDECSRLLKEGSFEAFFEYALDSEGLRELKKQGLTETEILKRIFRAADGSPGHEEFFELKNFSAIIFPEIMETPFSYDTRNEFRHTVSVRLRRPGGESVICLAELRMKQNPFQDRQFCFCPGIK